MSGDTTTVSPVRVMAGNWKQSDLPPPVGSSANTSLPASASRMISSCNGRKDVKPKYCFSTGKSRGTRDSIGRNYNRSERQCTPQKWLIPSEGIPCAPRPTAGTQPSGCSSPEMSRRPDAPETSRRSSADFRVQCRQDLRLGLTPAKDVLGGSVSSAAPFPLTPALSPEERENYRPRGDKSKHPDISHDDRQSTLSWGETAGVRGNGAYAISTGRSSEPDTLQTRSQFLAALDDSSPRIVDWRN